MKQMRCALSQPFLWVNKHGDRFYNESFGSVFSDVYNAMTANGGLMWSIFDDTMRRSMIDNGPLTPFNAIVVPAYLSMLFGLPYWLTAAQILAGQAIACYGLGYPLLTLLRQRADLAGRLG